MKKKILLIYMVLVSALTYAQQSTTDHFVLSQATVNPGGTEVVVTVSLVGENIYSGYNLDIQLPEGLEVVSKNSKFAISSGIYPYTMEYNDALEMDVPTYTHSVFSTYGVVGDRILRVACISTANEELTASNGALFKFYLKATSFAKPGTAEISLSGLNLTKADKTKFVPENTVSTSITVSTSAASSMAVSSSNKWSTCILPFDVALPDGVKAYTCTEKDDVNSVLKLKPASSIAAYTPYILYSESGYTGSLTGTVDAAKYPGSGYVTSGYLNGAIASQTVSEGYVLQNLDGGVKFYACGGKAFTIPAGKCWVTFPSGAKVYGFEIEDETSAINSVSESRKADDAIYTISGQRVTTMQPNTMYIKNGRTFINK